MVGSSLILNQVIGARTSNVINVYNAWWSPTLGILAHRTWEWFHGTETPCWGGDRTTPIILWQGDWIPRANSSNIVSDFEVLSCILYRKITLWFVISCKTNRMSIEKTPRNTTHSLGLGPLPQSWVTFVLNIKEPPLKLPLKPETAIYKCLAIKLDDKTKKTIHTKLLHVELFFLVLPKHWKASA